MSNGLVSFSEVKARVAFEPLLERYGLIPDLARKGDSLAGPCPICGATGKRPFTVNLAKNAWYCFAKCRGGGNVLDFVSRKEQVSVKAAAELLDDWFSLGLRVERKTATAPKVEPKERPPSVAQAPVTANEPLGFVLKDLDPEHSGFQEYGLTADTARSFVAGFATRGLMRGRLAIPVWDSQGELVAYVGVATESGDAERYRLPPKFHPEFEVFNLAYAKKAEGRVYLVSEIIAVLFLFEQGIERAVGLFDGSLSQAQEFLLRESFAEDTELWLVDRSSGLEAHAGRLAHHFSVRVLSFDELFARRSAGTAS